jgi:hypothetical protein
MLCEVGILLFKQEFACPNRQDEAKWGPRTAMTEVTTPLRPSPLWVFTMVPFKKWKNIQCMQSEPLRVKVFSLVPVNRC